MIFINRNNKRRKKRRVIPLVFYFLLIGGMPAYCFYIKIKIGGCYIENISSSNRLKIAAGAAG